MADATLIQLVAQGGFAVLFIWLMKDTRTEAIQRENRMAAALELSQKRQAVQAEQYAELSRSSAEAMRCMGAALNRLADVLEDRPCLASQPRIRRAVELTKTGSIDVRDVRGVPNNGGGTENTR